MYIQYKVVTTSRGSYDFTCCKFNLILLYSQNAYDFTIN